MPAMRRQFMVIRSKVVQVFASLDLKLGDLCSEVLDLDFAVVLVSESCCTSCGVGFGNTLRRFRMPDWSFEWTGATHEASEMGISHIEGMISSGPVRVHDEDDNRDSVESVVLPL